MINMTGRVRVVFVAVMTVWFIWMQPMKVWAADGSDIWQEMDMEEAESSFKALFPDYRFDGERVLSLVMQGKIKEAVQMLVSGLAESVKGEWGEMKTLFAMILILGVTAALFANFSDVFQSRQVSDIAFYFIYLLLIVVLLKVFNNAASTVKEMLSRLTVFMQMFVPAYLLAVGTAAGASSATAYYQLFLMAAYVIEKCYLSLLMPVVYCFILLSVMNGVWMEEKLNLLLDFVEKAVGYAIKITLGIITGFSVLQSLISPVVDSLESSALKKAVSVIPGIGNLTEGMFEMVVGSAVLIKNSIGIYITIVMLFICILPILKILLLSGVLKAGAALIGIVSDKRMTNCANRVGDGSLMLLKVALSAIGLFIISIAIITCTTNRGM
ncbi:MAG: stage III sporulation protein AE [Bacillus sp. (in: Bacteria)]|nr:stage III sporulation protein AE [Bacillus sp. (in: firmicutes)]MCM1425106.1 stage III sporulation protein AE [Eubacterium sp.]